MINVGYIGFGRFARHRHTILSEIKDIKFIGYFDVNKDLQHDIDIVRYETVEKLLDKLDAVFISVPPFYAPSFCKKALSKNTHVFCEKPPAINCRDLDGLAEASHNLVLAYGFNHRLHDSIIKIKEIIVSNKLGRILWMRGRYGKEVDDNYKDNWRCDKKLNGGGILIDQGIHLLDIMDWLAGGFDVNQSILSDNFLNINGVEDNAFLNLYSSKNKIPASLHSTITQWRHLFSLEIFLEKGSIVLNGLRTSSGSYGDEILTIRPLNTNSILKDKEECYPVNKSWGREMESFIRCIKESKPYAHSGLKEARNIMQLLDSIYANAVWSH
jgi:1,5-anhydro-D-fructose reductase (1,5-anhydro-D-mannitol-forming)